ncbi:MAG TPA: Gfo/Idh/MocA family oxidoreductase [Streptosporangiaceae bacterium]|nr:Gfo/Idh/MocA family oxidoreductase [Streptosporangiaceae bacterium]
MSEYGFGIVGAGTIAGFHAKAVAMVPDARLVAVTDLDPERASEFAGQQGCAAEPDLGALLAREDIGVVAVCVPSGQHAEVGVQAAKAGKHLVIEKPLDVSLDAADRLIAAATAAGVTVTVISQHRFDPGLIELRRLIDTGALGRLLLGQASTKWWRGQDYYDSADWRGTWAMDGGALMNQGIHYTDLLLWCLGPVAEVSAVTVTQAHDMEAEDCALATVRFTSGALGTITASTSVIPGFAERLELSGTEGSAIVEDGALVYQGFRDGRVVSAAPDPAGGAGAAASAADLGASAHAAQLADLLAAIAEGRDPAVTAADGRATLALIQAVYRSAREGRPVRPR